MKRPESAGGTVRLTDVALGVSSLAACENTGFRDYAACRGSSVITSSGAMSGQISRPERSRISLLVASA
jgi:hypothetical protein